MLSRQELRVRRVPADIEATEGWRRSNRWLLPHPISHRSYCPSAPPSPRQDQPHPGPGAHAHAAAELANTPPLRLRNPAGPSIAPPDVHSALARSESATVVASHSLLGLSQYRHRGAVISSTTHVISAILLLILITVMFGGFSLLWLLRDRLQGDQISNFRAGHAHAGVLVILTLVVVNIADRAEASGQRLWMIAAALFIFALAQSGGFFIALGNRPLGRVVTTVGAVGLAATVVVVAMWLLSNA